MTRRTLIWIIPTTTPWHLLLVLGMMFAPLFGPAATPALAAPNCTTTGNTVTCTFAYTGAPDTWTVPADITSATFDLYGASGGVTGPSVGGRGARVTATLAVTPNTTYQILVGGWLGFNGGGAPGTSTSFFGGAANGGGASDVRTDPFTVNDRLFVAGGGGGPSFYFGTGTFWAAGAGGYPSGTAGSQSSNAQGGAGGSQTAGGAGAPGAGDGSLGQGGNGGSSGSDGGGGGGGGGYYGGGGGAASYSGGGAGGGGSSYASPAATNVSYQNGVREADGQVIISYTLPDSTPPVITPIVSGTQGTNGWYTGDVNVTWSVVDNESVVSSTSGCDNQSVTSDTPGVSFTCSATSAGGTASQSVTLKRDATPPTVACGSADSAWHAGDISIACTASDTTSGLANATDTSFNLTTNVASGTETANATTTTRTIVDQAGNSATARPISGNQIDKKAPSISISAPTATTYLLNQAVNANYSCSDGGSGVASCSGPVANSAAINTASVGTKTFTVNAQDNVGNPSSLSVTYAVAYKVCLLYDPLKNAASAGSTRPIKLYLCDANGTNVSASTLSLKALNVDGSPVPIKNSRNANPNDLFRFDSTLTSGGYIYNLNTAGLSSGQHRLAFSVSSDTSNTYAATFSIK